MLQHDAEHDAGGLKNVDAAASYYISASQRIHSVAMQCMQTCICWLITSFASRDRPCSYKLFTFTTTIKATLKRKLILTGVWISLASRGWEIFFPQTHPPNLFCKVCWHCHQSDSCGQFKRGQCGQFTVRQCAHTGAWPMVCKAKWGSDTLS